MLAQGAENGGTRVEGERVGESLLVGRAKRGCGALAELLADAGAWARFGEGADDCWRWKLRR